MDSPTTAPPAPDSTASGDAVIDGLNVLLADSYALMAQTHLAHWNVEGPDFFNLHTAFQAQYEELFVAVDDIAERARALGGYALGGLGPLASVSRIEEFADGRLPATAFVEGLHKAHLQVIQQAKLVRDLAEKGGDLETQDLVIARVQLHEKTAWMLRSYLGGK